MTTTYLDADNPAAFLVGQGAGQPYDQPRGHVASDNVKVGARVGSVEVASSRIGSRLVCGGHARGDDHSAGRVTRVDVVGCMDTDLGKTLKNAACFRLASDHSESRQYLLDVL